MLRTRWVIGLVLVAMIGAVAWAAIPYTPTKTNNKMLLITIRQGEFSNARRETTTYQQVKYYRTQSTQDASEQQQLRVLNGHKAYISTGQSIPVPEISAYGYSNVAGIRYKDITSGFYVTPHLRGRKVLLDIVRQEHRLNRYGQGRIDINEVSTQIIAPLGEWVNIAGFGKAGQSSNDTVLYQTKFGKAGQSSHDTVFYQTNEQQRLKSSLYIKVDAIGYW